MKPNLHKSRLVERISTMRTAGRAAPSAPQGGPTSVPAETEWRRSAVDVRYVMLDGQVWLAQTNTVSCSDSSIAPLVTSTARQLTGLTAAAPSRSTATDERGNATETWTTVGDNIVTRHRRVPYATNVAETTLRYGDVVREVSVSGVVDTYAYDGLNRQVSHTDGRGNTSRTEYNVRGLRSASIDALGNRTAYAYDRYGNLSAVTNPLGNAVVYEYDLCGRRTYEGGATYPVRYTYDVFGNKTTMTTYRNESLGPASGDVTTWCYDEASNCMTNKVYADGKGPKYGYTPDGRLAQRIWARGIVTDYAYDGWGSLTNTVYSDGTPTVTLFYDAMGRQTNAVDAAGVTTFCYDDFGSLTNETVVGAAGENTIVRHWDAYGRTTGYSLIGLDDPIAPQRQTTIGYDAVTGRIATMLANGSDVPFTWSYLPGSDLKSSLAYPNGLTASWTYDADGQLLQVRNATPTDVISQYDYTYDAAGRRIEIARSGSAMSESRTDAYGYNVRGELTSATEQGGQPSSTAAFDHSYQYDNIGNRLTSMDLGCSRAYTSNGLNQYTDVAESPAANAPQGAVEEFEPLYDDDGNQTLMKTATGVWSVLYNGENRPVLWTRASDGATVSMAFDRMGRRVRCHETGGTAAGSVMTFAYDGYVCVARRRHGTGGAFDVDRFVWDPAEPVATRPLVFCVADSAPQYYAHDGNKNVSELVSADGAATAHYEYAPFGAVTYSAGPSAALNPYRFSSEYADSSLALVYYNYRHYEPVTGRWLSRDALEEFGSFGLYCFCSNFKSVLDFLGLSPQMIPIGPSPYFQKNVLWFGVAFDRIERGDKLLVVKHLKLDLYDCDTGKQIFYEGKAWLEEVSISQPNSNVRFAMKNERSMTMSSLINFTPPGKEGCRQGRILFSGDFYVNETLSSTPKGEIITGYGKSWFSYFGDDSSVEHFGSIVNYKGGLPQDYSNSKAFATFKMTVDYTCRKSTPEMIVIAKGNWSYVSVQRIDYSNQPRGPTGPSEAVWVINGERFFDD